MDHIDELVFNYQKGDEASGEEIMRLFGCHPRDLKLTAFIGKYYTILRGDVFDFADKDSRRFLALYISDESLQKRLIPFYSYRNTRAEALRVLDKIKYMYKVIPDEDLKQELRFLLLQQAKRFKKVKKNVTFAGYLYGSYRYALKNHLDSLFKNKDPYMHMPGKVEHLIDELYIDESTEIQLDDRMFIKAPLLVDDDELGNSWVRGISCGEEFKALTPLQRLILKLNYQDGLSDRLIAEKMNMHINTIFKHRKRAAEIVEETIQKLRKEGFYE